MNPYPCLNGAGWCTDPEFAIDQILKDYCRCEYSATKLYRNRIRSLPYQLMRYTDPMALANVVEEDLLYLYKNTFDGVQCSVTYDPNNQYDLEVESPRFHLEISLIINDGNQRFSLAKVLKIENKTVNMLGDIV